MRQEWATAQSSFLCSGEGSRSLEALEGWRDCRLGNADISISRLYFSFLVTAFYSSWKAVWICMDRKLHYMQTVCGATLCIYASWCTYSLLCYLRSAMPCLSSTCGLCHLRRCSSKHFASQLSALCKRTEHSLGLSRAKAKNSACFSRLTHYFVERIIALKNDVILTAAKSCQKNLKLTLLSKDS